MNESAFFLLLRTVLYDWINAFRELIKRYCAWFKKQKCHDHRPTQGGCVRIDHPAFVRPDPLIYSQQYLLSQGLAVTWDNPDISLFKGGIAVNSANLEPATTYEVRAQVWNNSLEAPVIGTPVHLRFHDFGIGPDPIPIGDTTVDVGVKGSPNQPGLAQWLWTTPSTPGHYCLQVLLDPVDDTNFANNLGQENTNVVEAHSPAEFTFTLRNNTRRAHRYRFEVDAYKIPALTKCDEVKPDKDSKRTKHLRSAHPVPVGFTVQLNPSSVTLNSLESTLIKVLVEPPPNFIGQQNINVNAFHDQGFAGGVTLICVKEV